ncbi:MAG: hypothetical protein QOI07_3602 [Verrucomicrobiota bacterium]
MSVSGHFRTLGPACRVCSGMRSTPDTFTLKSAAWAATRIRPLPWTSSASQKRRPSTSWNATCAARTARSCAAIPTNAATSWRCRRPEFPRRTRRRYGGRASVEPICQPRIPLPRPKPAKSSAHSATIAAGSAKVTRVARGKAIAPALAAEPARLARGAIRPTRKVPRACRPATSPTLKAMQFRLLRGTNASPALESACVPWRCVLHPDRSRASAARARLRFQHTLNPATRRYGSVRRKETSGATKSRATDIAPSFICTMAQ